MLTIALKTFLVLLGGFTYRVRGMGFNSKYSREICLFLSALPVALAVAAAALPWWVALLVFIGTYGADSLGHAKGMVYGSPTQSTADAWSVLLTTGIASGLPVCLAFAIYGDTATAAMALVAFALKPVAYYIGWSIPSTTKDLEQGPPLGEVFNGLFRMLWVAA